MHTAGQPHPEALEISDEELAEIALILEMSRSFSISAYKDKCMKRRVAIRMRSCQCHDAAGYCSLLRQNEHELDLLQKTLTVHVSQFFRNPAMFEKLRREVFPYLFANAAADNTDLRILSLGCAGGEEPYSLAILLREHFSPQLEQTRVTICALDIDLETILAARKAEFNPERLKEVPDDVRRRYFRPQGARMQLSAAIREMVTFNRGDVTALGSFQRHDLVLCRNTLIYFNRPDQERILNGITQILPPGGILVLGKSETLVGDVRRSFSALCPLERIYRRI